MRRFLFVAPPALGLFVTTAVGAILGAACEDHAASSAADDRPAPRAHWVGVEPAAFKCDSLTSPDALAAVLGAPVKPLETSVQSPRGVAAPCSYVLMTATPEVWTYDLDCRDGLQKRADALFTQYAADSAASVLEYGRQSTAGAIKPSDAGVVARAPVAATEVAVGARGLDHHGQALIFVDDDAPCYVRVVGQDAPRRLELARLIAKNLTRETAPMTPRPASALPH